MKSIFNLFKSRVAAKTTKTVNEYMAAKEDMVGQEDDARSILSSYRNIISTCGELVVLDSSRDYPSYTKEGDELFDAFWSFGRSGSKGDYKEISDIKAFMNSGLETASIEQLRFFVFDFTKEEKFHDGLFGTLCKDGTIEKVIFRLEEIAEL
ncbi:hypothetical protein SG34_012265 [Thalassomonas viridans]|uniref:Uncharacterized protein n=1 Tax=Thalassomonas viridans TaxID=137584 RepID=A0AAE9Z6C7_9GAMM|nr:hypothetical protein [Thalassomonas viridans]WDE07586.1 hypothetical protein SG34_012265 [Thalassomonas viridans]